jgi:hypothetical protein
MSRPAKMLTGRPATDGEAGNLCQLPRSGLADNVIRGAISEGLDGRGGLLSGVSSNSLNAAVTLSSPCLTGDSRGCGAI